VQDSFCICCNASKAKGRQCNILRKDDASSKRKIKSEIKERSVFINQFN
jgi:hypothetical protein